MYYIEIDEMPIEMNPYLSSDYNAKIVNSVKNIYLRQGVNCDIKTRDQIKYSIEIYPECEITSDDVIKSIYKFLEGSMKYAHYLSFIKKVDNKLMINKKDNKRIEIDLYFENSFFHKILQSIFIPIIIRPIKRDHIFLDNKKIETLTTYDEKNCFLINSDYRVTQKLIESNILNLSTFSNNHPLILDDKKYENYTLESNDMNLIYFLHVSDENLINIFYKVGSLAKKKLSIYLSPFLIPISSFYLSNQRNNHKIINETLIDTNTSIELNKHKGKIITLGYCDFYPNNKICEEIKKEAKKEGLIINLVRYKTLKDLLKSFNSLDVVLSLTYPIFDDPISLCFQLLYDKSENDQKKIYNMLLDNNFLHMEELFKNTNHNIPLFQSKNLFYKKKNNLIKPDSYGNLWEEKIYV